MNTRMKNVKINEIHHKLLKLYCDRNGLKMYKVIERWIDENCKVKKKDLYGE